MSPRDARPTPRAESGRYRPLALLVSLLRIIGWLGLATGLAIVAFDQAHLGESWLRAELSRRLDPLGSEADFDSLSIDWLGPGVSVRGLRLGKPGTTHLEIEEFYVAVDLSSFPKIGLARLDLERGSLRVHEPLLRDVQALLELSEDPTRERLPRELALPPIQVREFSVQYQDPSGTEHDLGRIDFSLASRPGLPARISGRVVLPAASSTPRPPEVYLHGVANLNGHLELYAGAQDLRIEDWRLPAITPFDQLTSMQPAGRVQLHSKVRLDLLSDELPEVDLRLAVSGARLTPPLSEAPIEEFDLLLSAERRQRMESTEAHRWSGGGRFSASWADQAVEGGLRIGRSALDGSMFEGWVHLPDLNVQTPELVALKPRALLIQNLYDSLTPEGRVTANVEFALREGWLPGTALTPKLEYLVRVVPRSRLRAAWHGWYLPESPDAVPIGFPMPAFSDEGAVFFAHNVRFPRRELLDVDFRAHHPTGSVRVTYQQWSNPVDMPPFARGYGEMESDLFVIVPRISIDDRMRECMYGLRQIPELETLFDDYGLESGRADVVLRLATRAELPMQAVDVMVNVEQLGAAWSELPVPARELEGEVQVRGDGLGSNSIRFDVRGRTRSAGRVTVSGRQRFGPATVDRAGEPLGDLSLVEVDALQVHAEELDLQGEDVALLAEEFVEVAQALERFTPTGQADVSVTRAAPGPGFAALTHLEITPRDELSLLATNFPVPLDSVRGRVIVELAPTADSEESKDSGDALSLRVAPLVASWREQALVAVSAELPAQAQPRGRLLAAGLEPQSSVLRRDLERATGRSTGSLDEALAELETRGAVDLELQFEAGMSEADATLVPRIESRFFLRENLVGQAGGLALEHLSGVLELVDGEVRAQEVRGELSGSEVTLEQLSARSGESGFALDAQLRAEPLELGPSFLRRALDEATVSTLVDQFGFRGSLEVSSARLRVESQGEGLELSLSGSGTLNNVYAEVGLPVSIRSAELNLEELVFDGTQLRGWGRLSDLYGLVLDRDISQTDLLVSYYGSRLSIESLEGTFCKGRIRGATRAEGDTPGAAPVFSVDLLPPYVFQSNLAIEDVDVGLLLEDVFATEIANRGRASAEARLRGELSNLLSITGTGHGSIYDSVLWSVPVLRSLFQQLGYDATAVFDDMSTDFRVENGLVYMEDMHVHSPLINLDGRGTLGLDGSLHHDLQVKYSLANKVGPLGALIHMVQNTLLSVSIRGDLARPRVFLTGALSGPFNRVDDDWRAIPLPGLSPLPDRF